MTMRNRQPNGDVTAPEGPTNQDVERAASPAESEVEEPSMSLPLTIGLLVVVTAVRYFRINFNDLDMFLFLR